MLVGMTTVFSLSLPDNCCKEKKKEKKKICSPFSSDFYYFQCLVFGGGGGGFIFYWHSFSCRCHAKWLYKCQNVFLNIWSLVSSKFIPSLHLQLWMIRICYFFTAAAAAVLWPEQSHSSSVSQVLSIGTVPIGSINFTQFQPHLSKIKGFEGLINFTLFRHSPCVCSWLN